jgi:Tol biopolymer transport system component
MNADGTSPVQVAAGTGTSWSPDGSRIAFEAASNNFFHVFVVNADGTGLANLTEGVFEAASAARWHPDGSRLLFKARINGIWDLFEMNVTTRAWVNLTNDALFQSSGEYSPDGTRIAFEQTDVAAWTSGLFVMNADGTDRVRLVLSQVNGGPTHIRWSSDGSRIAFSGTVPGAPGGTVPEVFVVKSDGTDLTNVSSHPDWFDSNPSWQP